METPFDFASIGLHQVHAAIDYGAKALPDSKHGEFIFDATHPGPQRFEVFLNSKPRDSILLALQYHFRPDSGWDGEKFSDELPVRTMEDRSLIINPYADLGFLQLEVSPGRVDPGIVTSTDVQLSIETVKAGALKRQSRFVLIRRRSFGVSACQTRQPERLPTS